MHRIGNHIPAQSLLTFCSLFGINQPFANRLVKLSDLRSLNIDLVKRHWRRNPQRILNLGYSISLHHQRPDVRFAGFSRNFRAISHISGWFAVHAEIAFDLDLNPLDFDPAPGRFAINVIAVTCGGVFLSVSAPARVRVAAGRWVRR